MKNRVIWTGNNDDVANNVVSSSTSPLPIDASSSSSLPSSSRDEETQPKSVISGVDDADGSTTFPPVSKVKSASKKRRLVYDDEEEVCGKVVSKKEVEEEEEEETEKGKKRTKSGGRSSLEKDARGFLDLEAGESRSQRTVAGGGDWRVRERSDTEEEGEDEGYEHDDKENQQPTNFRVRAQVHRQGSPYPRHSINNNDDDDDDDDENLVITQDSDEELDRQASVFHSQSMKAGRFPVNKGNAARKLAESVENIEGKISVGKKKSSLEL